MNPFPIVIKTKSAVLRPFIWRMYVEEDRFPPIDFPFDGRWSVPACPFTMLITGAIKLGF